MPIQGLSESVRLPRLGKIHLGYKHPEKGYPVKTDYFVFPKDNSCYAQLVQTYGDKPKELRILIPVEDEEEWASQYYKSYNLTYGLVCRGDGINAYRMVDVKTEKLPGKDAGPVKLIEMECRGKKCPEYIEKKCGEVMNLRFLLPEVPGLGVWQIDTGSINSILNINSCAKIIKKAFGRISLIPLKLSLESIQVNNPETGKKQTVYVMNLRTDVTLAQLADAAREQAKTFMLTGPELMAEIDNDIDSLYEPRTAEGIKPKVTIEKPVEQVSETNRETSGPIPENPNVEIQNEAQSEARKTPDPPATKSKPKRDPATVKTQTELMQACHKDFGTQPTDLLKELNLTRWADMVETPAEAYKRVASVQLP